MDPDMNTPQIPASLREELKKCCAEVTWRPTSTYPDHMAHAYILWKNEPELCQALAEAIAAYGYDKPFYSKTYRYLELGDGYKYWGDDTLVNREDLALTRARERRADQRSGS